MDFSFMATNKRRNGDISTYTSLLLLTLKLVSSKFYFFILKYYIDVNIEV